MQVAGSSVVEKLCWIVDCTSKLNYSVEICFSFPMMYIIKHIITTTIVAGLHHYHHYITILTTLAFSPLDLSMGIHKILYLITLYRRILIDSQLPKR